MLGLEVRAECEQEIVRRALRCVQAMLLHAMSLLVMRRLLVEVEMLRDRAELIVLPPPCPLTIAPIDFSHADELIRRGYEDSRDYLDSVEAKEAPAPLPMAMHSHRQVRTGAQRSLMT